MKTVRTWIFYVHIDNRPVWKEKPVALVVQNMEIRFDCNDLEKERITEKIWRLTAYNIVPCINIESTPIHSPGVLQLIQLLYDVSFVKTKKRDIYH